MNDATTLPARGPSPARDKTRATQEARPKPVWTHPIMLNSDFSQRVFRRTWDRLKADLYVLTVRTRAYGMDAAANILEEQITGEFSKARTDLESDLARTDVLMDEAKLSQFPRYEGAMSAEAEYSTPRAREYLLLIQQLDHLLMRYDALWFSGVIETAQRVRRSQAWQQRLIKVANRIRAWADRARAGLTRETNKQQARGRHAEGTGPSGSEQPAQTDLAVSETPDAATATAPESDTDTTEVNEARDPEDIVLEGDDSLPPESGPEPGPLPPDAHRMNGSSHPTGLDATADSASAMASASVTDADGSERRRRRKDPKAPLAAAG